MELTIKSASLKQRISKLWPRKDASIQHWFAVLALTFGLALVFVIPPEKGSDEWSHFFRAYQVSDLGIVGQKITVGYGGYLPTSILNMNDELIADRVNHNPNIKYHLRETRSLLRMRLNANNKHMAYFAPTTLYSAVNYILPAAFIEIGKPFNAPPVIILYLARMGSLVGWVALVWWAIKITPKAKWAFLALALTPVSLFQGSIVSADGVTNGLSFLMVACILRFWLGDKLISTRELAAFTGLSFTLALSKPLYIAMTLLIFIIPSHRFARPNRAIAWKIGIPTISVALAYAWIQYVKPIQDFLLTHFQDPTVVISPPLQLQGILHDPWAYIVLMWNTLTATPSDSFYHSFIGVLGSYDTQLPLWLVFWVGLLIALSLMLDGVTQDQARGLLLKKLYIGAIGLGIVTLVMTGLYLAFAPLHWPNIYGLQGRYLVAISALLIPLTLTKAPLLRGSSTRLKQYLLRSYFMVLPITVLNVIIRYYFATG